jgi:NADH-quinone oxidoreductase subunit F
MSYESLSDGGFATGSMLGSGGFIVYNDTSSYRNAWNFARFIIMKVVDNLHVVKVQVGKKVLWRIENGQDVKKTLLWSIQSKIEKHDLSTG